MYMYYVYINTKTGMYTFKKNMLCLCIKYIYIKYNNLNIKMYIRVNIFKVYTVCVFIHIINKLSTHYTHILCKLF